jgi:hypothetical protein
VHEEMKDETEIVPVIVQTPSALITVYMNEPVSIVRRVREADLSKPRYDWKSEDDDQESTHDISADNIPLSLAVEIISEALCGLEHSITSSLRQLLVDVNKLNKGEVEEFVQRKPEEETAWRNARKDYYLQIFGVSRKSATLFLRETSKFQSKLEFMESAITQEREKNLDLQATCDLLRVRARVPAL